MDSGGRGAVPLPEVVKNTIEAALLAAGRPLSVAALCEVFADRGEGVGAAQGPEGDPPSQAHGGPGPEDVRGALRALAEDYRGRGIELREVASGFRIQVRAEYGPRLGRLWAERPQRYSRALLETLALIAYRQPISRAEIEEVRGVGVSSSIFRTLQERDWVRVVGHRETPGRPALYGTTRQFLDDFNLRRLSDLPPLSDLQDVGTAGGDGLEALIAGATAALHVDPTEGDARPGGVGDDAGATGAGVGMEDAPAAPLARPRVAQGD